jgi:hypothetical protein
MNRPPGRRQPCTLTDAKARLRAATAFLEAANATTDPDVKATNAIHAAVAAADAICCVALRERSADGNHLAAVELLRTVDPQLAATLNRAVSRKNQAADETRTIAAKDATTCVRQATTLTDAARTRILNT